MFRVVYRAILQSSMCFSGLSLTLSLDSKILVLQCLHAETLNLYTLRALKGIGEAKEERQ